MDYVDLRDSIESGDLLFFEPSTWFGKLITTFSGGYVSHCGIAVWMFDEHECKRLMILEGFSGGCRLVNMSAYAHRPMHCVRTVLDWATVEDYAMGKTGVVHYGYLDFLYIWLREALVRAGLPRVAALVPDSVGEVCSQMVADVLKHSNQFELPSTLMSPAALREYAIAHAAADVNAKQLTLPNLL